MKNKNLKENKGITLIALVITIIVLLILAAVSIATLTGENGILTKAQTAKKETEEGQEEEQVRLAQAEANMNDEETEYAGIKIPAGMAPTRAEGESTVDEGLVAVDKNGNEWVWVEVPESIYINPEYTDGEEQPITETDYDKIESVLKKYAAPYVGKNSEYKDEYYDGCGVEPEEYNEKYHAMLKSVYENKGFWVGRYEAGIEGSTGTDEASLAKARTTNSEIDDSFPKAICQKDAIPYNFVTVSQAEKLSEAMSPDEGKTGSLLFGIQWDLVCKFLEEKSDLKQEDINSNSEKWGNYYNVEIPDISTNAKSAYLHYENDSYVFSNKWTTELAGKTKVAISDRTTENPILLSTGASEKTKKLNIYDFAGNECEWTLEHALIISDNPCSFRGCRFNQDGSTSPASFRDYNTTSGHSSYSFRPALY